MILALVGQKIGRVEACLAATFIHGFAAESYCGDYCELSLTAANWWSIYRRRISDLPAIAPIHRSSDDDMGMVVS